MNKLFNAFFLSALIFISACNGSSDKSSEPDNTPQVATNLSLALLNSEGIDQLSFEQDETITVQVTITDQFNAPMTGSRVDFSADLGTKLVSVIPGTVLISRT